MISSYQFSERYSARSLLWDFCGALVAVVRSLLAVVGLSRRVASHIELGTLFLGLLIVAGMGLLCAAVAFVVANPCLIAGAVIIGAYAYIFRPRTAVRK